MNAINDAVRAIEHKISQLQHAREILVSLDSYVQSKPWKVKSKTGGPKRRLSVQAIANIKKAQHKRWAKYHRTHPKKAA